MIDELIDESVELSKHREQNGWVNREKDMKDIQERMKGS